MAVPAALSSSQKSAAISIILSSSNYVYSAVIPPPPKCLNRSHFSKFTMTSNDLLLIDALEDWREKTTILLYGEGFLRALGSGLIMPMSTLDHIVDCAHTYKITTIADLQKETCWSAAERCGHQIIDLILKHVPIPTTSSLFTSTPLQQLSSTNTFMPTASGIVAPK